MLDGLYILARNVVIVRPTGPVQSARSSSVHSVSSASRYGGSSFYKESFEGTIEIRMSATKRFLFQHVNQIGEIRFVVVPYVFPHPSPIASTLGKCHHFLHGLVIHAIFSHTTKMVATHTFEMPVHYDVEGKMKHRMQPSSFNR